ncbi:G-patch 2 domain containing protein [Trichuris trichiura]|uniref:G-patch 2 domain containing protein n=1 Tax=Trichuris trichiura TaxID=36087 RepID=A0A077Z674_TRITR|nr:G-patch 2 domain containing protein [Trichuris trichiura]
MTGVVKSFKVRQAPNARANLPLQRSKMFDHEEEETDNRQYTRTFSSKDSHRSAAAVSEKTDVPIIAAIPDSYSIVRRGADEKLGSLEELESEQDIDYDSIPVEEYGKALLRGLGWSEGAAIGKTNKQVVKVIESEPRPKGLGLGAAVKSKTKEEKKDNVSKEEEEELQLKVGSCIKRTDAPHTNEYGKVISMDEDNCRVVCHMLLSKETLSLSQYSVEVVSSAEYLQKGRCINQEKYDTYKKKEVVHTTPDVPLSRNPLERKEVATKRDQPVNRIDHAPTGWMYPMVRVRFIDRRYAKGKFYKKKGRIEDMVSKDTCTVVFDDGGLLENVKEHQLETVVPRSCNAEVMVLFGKWRGRVGRMLEQDSSKCQAVVQVADDTLKLSYDDFAEYVGDPVDD